MVIQQKYNRVSSVIKRIQGLCGEGRSYSTDGINTEMNRSRADHIKKLPTAAPRDGGKTGVCPDTIPIIDDDRGEKERGGSSRSRAVIDCN